LQLVTLSLSLGSLAVGHDLVPLFIPLVTADLGIVLLVLSSVLTLSVRRGRLQLKPWYGVVAAVEPKPAKEEEISGTAG
jgi:hypothetical protein